MPLKHIIIYSLFLSFFLSGSIEAGTLMITGEQLNVRSGPGRTHRIVAVVNKDETFQVLQEQDEWYQISVEGLLGWVPAKGVILMTDTGLVELLEQADQYFYRQQFTTPPEANAYDLYQEVLQQEPENAHALKRIQQMAKTYKSWADAAYSQKDYSKARVFYSRYLFLVPKDDGVKTRLERLERSGGEAAELLKIVCLRNEPTTVSAEQIVNMLKKQGFHHPEDWSKYGLSPSMTGHFRHDYVLIDAGGIPLILDHATQLLWPQESLNRTVTWKGAFEYVEQLNRMGYAGYTDWRLPTIEELASLLEPQQEAHNLYLAAFFGSTPLWCWSADRTPEPDMAWYVSFNSGGIQQHTTENTAFVLAVRSYQ